MSLFICPQPLTEGDEPIDLSNYFLAASRHGMLKNGISGRNNSALLRPITVTMMKAKGCGLYLQCDVTKLVLGFLIADSLKSNGWVEVDRLASIRPIFNKAGMPGFMGKKLGSILLTALSLALLYQCQPCCGYHLDSLAKAKSFYRSIGMIEEMESEDEFAEDFEIMAEFFSPNLPCPDEAHYQNTQPLLAADELTRAALTFQRVWRSQAINKWINTIDAFASELKSLCHQYESDKKAYENFLQLLFYEYSVDDFDFTLQLMHYVEALLEKECYRQLFYIKKVVQQLKISLQKRGTVNKNTSKPVCFC